MWSMWSTSTSGLGSGKTLVNVRKVWQYRSYPQTISTYTSSTTSSPTLPPPSSTMARGPPGQFNNVQGPALTAMRAQLRLEIPQFPVPQ